jgi:CheY-like chemotaxis protein
MSCEVKVLWVEDSEDDVFLLTRAMYKSRQTIACQHVWDGSEAIDYLLGKGPYADRLEFPLPDVILTDIRMPMTDGVKLTKWLREHAQFKTIPVWVLSGSNLSADILAALKAGATDYLVKPDGEPSWDKTYSDLLTKWHKQCALGFTAALSGAAQNPRPSL